MSKSLQWFIVIAIIFAVFVLSKPSDQQCLAKAAGDGIVGTFAESTGLTGYAYQVEDHIVYKSIRSRITGKEVGYGFLGSVTMR